MMNARRVTSQDVADAAGVSRTTVSLVLNKVQGAKIREETRQRVIAAARELGYVPDAAARALVSRRAQIIGLVLTRRPDQVTSDGFLTQLLDGLLGVIKQSGLRLLIEIVDPEHQKEAYLELIRAKHIDGVILSGPRYDDDALRTLEEEAFPVVLLGQLPDTNHYSVDINNRVASRIAVEHLLGLGHKEIACITNADLSYTAATERLIGYQEALEAAGLSLNDELVGYGDFSPESGYAAMMELLGRDVRFTAAFIASDEVALGAQAAIRECGLRVPDDIALVGFDDLPLSRYMDPPLTTISVPAVQLARQASTLLIKLLKGEKFYERHVVLKSPLHVRESCGAKLSN
ncbi:MAG: LacI family DNA-binding transcriptional regulator [Anaerolineales bacterium]|nr:MAG: LacI family DNA-binding transcriptional regulator [Anaerolineales bacterium]